MIFKEQNTHGKRRGLEDECFYSWHDGIFQRGIVDHMRKCWYDAQHQFLEGKNAEYIGCLMSHKKETLDNVYHQDLSIARSRYISIFAK